MPIKSKMSSTQSKSMIGSPKMLAFNRNQNCVSSMWHSEVTGFWFWCPSYLSKKVLGHHQKVPNKSAWVYQEKKTHKIFIVWYFSSISFAVGSRHLCLWSQCIITELTGCWSCQSQSFSRKDAIREQKNYIFIPFKQLYFSDRTS